MLVMLLFHLTTVEIIRLWMVSFNLARLDLKTVIYPWRRQNGMKGLSGSWMARPASYFRCWSWSMSLSWWRFYSSGGQYDGNGNRLALEHSHSVRHGHLLCRCTRKTALMTDDEQPGSYPLMSPIVSKEQAIARYMWASAVFAWNRPVPMPRGAVMDQYDEAVVFLHIHEEQCMRWIHWSRNAL